MEKEAEEQRLKARKRDATGTQALHMVQRQVLQRVGSRAHAVRAVEEQRWMLQMVQRQVLQQVGSGAQAVQTVEEGIEASRGQQVRQGEETAAAQDEDSSPETVEEEGSHLGELLSRRGNKPEVEQGLHREVILRWLNGAQGDRIVEAAAGMLGPEEVKGDEEALPQYETTTTAYNSGPETTEESPLGDKPEVEYRTQRDSGLKVTAGGFGSEEGWEVQHVWQEGLQGDQEQRVQPIRRVS